MNDQSLSYGTVSTMEQVDQGAGMRRRGLLGTEQTCPRDPEGRPRIFSSAHGAYLVDSNGERWIDLDNGRGSVLLGHGDPDVAEAVQRAARGELGSTTGWSPLLDRVLERGWSLLGGEVLALFRTGTAALRSVICAVRDARAEELGTERPLVLSAGYHGYDTMWLHPDRPFEVNADGILDFLFELNFLEDTLRRQRVAAIVISPDRSAFPAQWYADVRRLARDAGVPIVADEVKVGLRHAPELVMRDLEPDVWIVAKTIANGAPVAMAGGRAALLGGLREVSFTSFFEPTVLAAVDVTLERVASGEPQRQIARHAGAFVSFARQALAEARLPIAIAGDAHLFHFVCASSEVDEAFQAASAAERILLFEGDNQAPSAALAGETLEDLRTRFAAVCAALAGRFPEQEIDELAWYRAAWYSIDGLAARDHDAGRARELVDQLWDD
jgi:neamine transaminase/2'-deamino-2'-hydroxyneamine transaminase/neomycin C transaminase